MSEKPYSVPTPADFFNWLNQLAQPMLEAGAKVGTQSPVPAMADPLAMWKSMTEFNEQAWSQFLKQMVGTPEFAAGLGRTASSQAVIRETVRKSAKLYLDAANMPSRDDVTHVASQIVALDAKVDDMEDLLQEANIEQLSQKLEAVVTRLDKLDQQAQLSTRMNAMEATQNKLDELNGKLDRLAAFESRLSAIEAKLDKLAQVEAKPLVKDEPVSAKASPANKSEPVATETKKLVAKAPKKPARPRTTKPAEENK